MKTHFVNTDTIYHDIINAPDAATRTRLYREKLVQPWQSMMDMVAQMMPGDGKQDKFAGARQWGWLLPKDLETAPDSLSTLEAADAWNAGARALAQAAGRFEPYADRIPFDHIEGWLVLADPAHADPVGRGYTGGIDFTQPRFIAQFDTVNDYNLPRLPGLVVHEMHHLIRMRAFPWSMGTTVADYIVVEGTAESFAASLFGEEVVGYYVSECEDLATARRLIGENLDKTGFDVIRAYIFGDHFAEQYRLPEVGMPAFGGYAVGYHVVQAYLKRTGTSIEEATFTPADEIVAESGYFD